MQDIIILAHNRGLNKAEGFLRAYKDANVTLIVDHEPKVEKKPYVQYAKRMLVVKDFDLMTIISQVRSCDRIWCVNENLFPIQAQLESYYQINNLTPFAAEVLSNKQMLDEFCRKVGLGSYVPRSITPTFHRQLEHFGNNEIFTKPDIGTGSNVFFPGDVKIDYRRWNNRHHLLKYLADNDVHNQFFEMNVRGMHTERFNHKPCKMMVQEYHWSEIPSVAPCGFINEGKVEILFYMRNSKIRFGEDINPDINPIDGHASSRTSDLNGERAVWIGDAPDHVRKVAEEFLTTVAKELRIKNMFFAGPDFHVDGDKVIAIDLNPRPGQFINVLNAANGYSIFDDIIHGRVPQIKRKAMFATALLKPGIVKEVSDYSVLKPFISPESHDIVPGTTIPDFQHLFNKQFSVILNINGETEEELFRNYRDANRILQNCITY